VSSHEESPLCVLDIADDDGYDSGGGDGVCSDDDDSIEEFIMRA